MRHKTFFLKQCINTFFTLVVLFGLSIGTHTVLAAWSNSTDCSLVSTCQSDTSVKGENAGTVVCDAQGLDYIPACNNSRCKNPSTGKFGYACGEVPVLTGGYTDAPAYCGTSTTYSCVQSTTSCSSLTPSKVENSACKAWCGGTQKYCEVSGAGASDSSGSDTSGANSTACAAGFEKVAGVCFPTDTELPDPEGGILQILGNFFAWLLAVFGILAIGAFIISGVQYLISAGDDDMIKIAKRNMTWSIVGVIVGLSGWVIMQAVLGALNANPFF